MWMESKDDPMTELPIACTLDSASMQDRVALWTSIDPEILARERTAGRLRVVYRATDQVRELLPSLVAAERRCCGFASWLVHDTGDTLDLIVTADDDMGLTAIASVFEASP